MEVLCCWTSSKGWTDVTSPETNTTKIAVVGEDKCGKTSLIFRFTRGHLPRDWEDTPTGLDTDVVELLSGKKKLNVEIHDTSGTYDLAKVRALAYQECDVILVCFSLDCRDAVQKITEDWGPEVRHMAKGLPFVLVGTKSDLRESAKKSGKSRKEIDSLFVTTKEGRRLSKTVGAEGYFECSAHDGSESAVKTIKRIFGKAIREALKR